MNKQIQDYISNLSSEDQEICFRITEIIDLNISFTESKLWHAHPVWFIEGNPIVGFSKQKKGIRLMFWSGADFEEDSLNVMGGKFKDASIFYNNLLEINEENLIRWIGKSQVIQWDYKNIVKRKGKLERI